VKAWRWVRLDVVFAIHDLQLSEHGGLSGVPNVGRLKAALARPQNQAAYARPDAASLAAAYPYSLVRNHPFADGNKRTAWVVARLFLADNGYRFHFEPAEAVRIMEGVAGGAISESELAAWFRQRIDR
jgi:death-on-curing protein